MTKLGDILKEVRKNHGFTLRYIEEQLGISNAYLSQLENNKIKKPSANILYKLSSLYGISLKSLLGDAGIIEKEKETENMDSDFMKRIAFSSENMTLEEKEMVIKYLEFLKSQKKN